VVTEVVAGEIFADREAVGERQPDLEELVELPIVEDG